MSKRTEEQFNVTVGIECHVQLKTLSKLFAGVTNDAREADPNTTVSPICFGLPGVLPVLNRGAVDLAIRAGIALNSEVAKFSKFDRKHYFYPDLPKGYQITQYDMPILTGGYVEIELDGKTKKIGIERAHLEEDAGKLIHPSNKDYSLVDLNRAGTPLLEIVSKPEMHSAAEAKAYAKELYLLMKFSGASDVDLYHGHMRFDVNISLNRPGDKKLGVRTEIKNLNSFRSIERAIDYEISRQSKILASGNKVIQETRGWDEEKQITISQRTKEEAQDYRYFPEPDIPPVLINNSQIDTIKKQLKFMPNTVRSTLSKAGIKRSEADVVMHADASYEGDELPFTHLLLSVAKKDVSAITFAYNWIANYLLAKSFDTKQKKTKLPSSEQVLSVYKMFAKSKLSSNNAYKLLAELKDNDNPELIAERLGYIQVSDQDQLTNYVEQAIKDNPKAASDVSSGEDKAIGFLVGQVMKLSKGQADPKITKEIIIKKLRR